MRAAFVIYVSIVLTLLMALSTFLYTTYKFQVVTIAVLTISHGISILVGLFAQKLYLMVRHPDRNNPDVLMRRTSMSASLNPALLLPSRRSSSTVALVDLEKARATSLFAAAAAAASVAEAGTRKCSLNCAHCDQLERTQQVPEVLTNAACPKPQRTMSERSPECGTAHGAGTRYTPARQRHVSVDQVTPSTGAVGRYLTRSRQTTSASEELETRGRSIDEADAHSHKNSVSVVSITSIQSDSPASSGVFASAAHARLSTSSGTSLNTITESDSVVIREIEQPAPAAPHLRTGEAEPATGGGASTRARKRSREVTFAELLASDLSSGTTIARKPPSAHTDSHSSYC